VLPEWREFPYNVVRKATIVCGAPRRQCAALIHDCAAVCVPFQEGRRLECMHLPEPRSGFDATIVMVYSVYSWGSAAPVARAGKKASPSMPQASS
jgi:hypothetical protein